MWNSCWCKRKSQKIIGIHPLGSINVSPKLYGNPSDSCWNIYQSGPKAKCFSANWTAKTPWSQSIFSLNSHTDAHTYLAAQNKYFSCKYWHLQTRSTVKQQTSCQHRSAWQCVSVKGFKAYKRLSWPPFHHYVYCVLSVLSAHQVSRLTLLGVEPLSHSHDLNDEMSAWSMRTYGVGISRHAVIWLAATLICQRESHQAITIKKTISS